MIQILSIVNLPFPRAIVTFWLRCICSILELWWFCGWLCVHRFGVWRQLCGGHRPHHRSQRGQQMEWGSLEGSPEHCLRLLCQEDCQTLYTWFKVLSLHAGDTSILENATLNIVTVNREIRATQTGGWTVLRFLPLISKKSEMCKQQAYAKRCILNAQRHKWFQAIDAPPLPELGENLKISNHLKKNVKELVSGDCSRKKN